MDVATVYMKASHNLHHPKLPMQLPTSHQKPQNNTLNPYTPPAPICGIWMTLKPPESQEKMIFHPRFLWKLGKQVVHHIQLKNHFGRSPSFCKN
jgi:hypothetical protein